MPRITWIAVDPSYTSLGYAFTDNGLDFIRGAIKLGASPGQGFVDLTRRATVIRQALLDLCKNQKFERLKVIMEYPPPFGQWSSGLYGLDFILTDFWMRCPVDVLKVVPPSKIHSLLDPDRVKAKKETIARVLEIVELNKLKIGNNKLKTDEADALLLLLYLLYGEGNGGIRVKPKWFVEKKWAEGRPDSIK